MNLRSLLLASAIALAAIAAPQAARAACGSIPYTFTNNSSIVDANTTNSNNNHFQSCATNVDNTQVGSAGFYASQLIPTGATQAIFGGVFGYTFAPGAAGQVPLTVGGTSGQTVDLFDVCAVYSSGCSTKSVWVDSAGLFHFGTTAGTLSSGAGVPSASCSPGAVYSNTSATNITNLLYGCVSTNTWNPLSPGSAGTVGFEFVLYQNPGNSLATTSTPPQTTATSAYLINVSTNFNSPVITGMRVYCATAAVGGTNNDVQLYRGPLGASFAQIGGSDLTWTTATVAHVTFGSSVSLSADDVLQVKVVGVDTTAPKSCTIIAEGTQNA